MADAGSKLDREIIPEAVLPNRVFVSGWSIFRFFRAELAFGQTFIVAVMRLLEVDDATVAVVKNETEAWLRDEPPLAAITRRTTAGGYREELKKIKLATPEAFGLDSYSAMPDKGAWCAFWDGKENIGVFAIRSPADLERYRSALDLLFAGRLACLTSSNSSTKPFTILRRSARIALEVNYPEDDQP